LFPRFLLGSLAVYIVHILFILFPSIYTAPLWSPTEVTHLIGCS